MLRQVLNHIDRYLTGKCILRDLETWLLSSLQQILDSGDDAAIEVANQVDAALVEFGERLLDEATLRERLDSCLRLRETIFISSGTEHPPSVRSTAAVETIKSLVELPGQVENLRLVHAFD